MDLSFSELKDLVFNASMGSNLPAGVCEDLSFGVTFLESRSLPGGKELLYSLNCKRHPPVSPQKNGVSLIFSNSRAIFEGVSAIDLLVSESCKSVILENIDSSMLLVGLASNYYGFSFSFHKNKEICAALFNDQLNWENDYFSNFFISAESKSLYRERYRTNAFDSPFRMSNDSSVWSWIFPR